MFVIETQGQVLQARNLAEKNAPPQFTGKRGIICIFSAASRRRLMDLLARMDNSYRRCTFVTLTFQKSPSAAEAKAAFKRFLERVRDYFPEASAIWRMEHQPERGALHFHLIFFNLTYWPQYHLQDTWTECTDEPLSIADIRLIRKFSVYMAYVSKYIAKPDDRETPSLENASYSQNGIESSSGKWWGYHQKHSLPLAQHASICTDDVETGRYCQWWIKALSRGRSGDSLYSQKLFNPRAGEMFHFVLEIVNDIIDPNDLVQLHGVCVAQWFGSPVVLDGTGVPIAEGKARAPASTHPYASSPNPMFGEMPPGEGIN